MERDQSILRRPLILMPLAFILVASLVAATAWDASATHRRLRRKASLAQSFTGPDNFVCVFVELEQIHDYLCGRFDGSGFRLTEPDRLVPTGVTPPNPEDVSDLAVPNQFRCAWTGPAVDPTQERTDLTLYACRYRHLHSSGRKAVLVTHRFRLSEIVLAEFAEEDNLASIWVPPHPPVTNGRAA
jgi:hypothetical protein